MSIITDKDIDITNDRIDESHKIIDNLLEKHRHELTRFYRIERLANLKHRLFVRECVSFKFNDAYYIRIRMSGYRLTKPSRYLFNFFAKAGWKDYPVKAPEKALESLHYERQMYFQIYCKGDFYTAEYNVSTTTDDLVIDYVDIPLPIDKKLQFSAIMFHEKGMINDNFYYWSLNFPNITQAEWNAQTDYFSKQYYISSHLNGTSKKELYLLYYIRQFYSDAVGRKHFDAYVDGYSVEADIYIPSLQTVIEYDGGYWHNRKLERDNKKNEWFQQNNYYIIRVRDADLPDLEPVQGTTILHGVDFGGKHSDECVVDLIHCLATLETNDLKKKQLECFSLTYEEYCNDEMNLCDLIKERVEQQNGLQQHKLKRTPKKRSQQSDNQQPVLQSFCIGQYTKEGEYIQSHGSYDDASKLTGISKSSICRAATGYNQTAGGYQWRRLLSTDTPTAIEAIINENKENQSKPVIQVSLDGEPIAEFESIGMAERESKVNRKSIRCVLTGKQKTAGGFYWIYKE